MTLKKYGCSIERAFHPNLRVKLIQNAAWPDMAGLMIRVIYKDREFEFEMTKDE